MNKICSQNLTIRRYNLCDAIEIYDYLSNIVTEHISPPQPFLIRFSYFMPLLLFSMLLIVQPSFAEDSLLDSRDGKTYKTIKIGDRTWLAENLNYDAKGSACYDKKADNCQKCGRLYDWETAAIACPSGWHLPTDAEWITFEETIGEEDWNGFSVLHCGYRSMDGGFDFYGYFAKFWSATENGAKHAWFRDLDAGMPKTMSGKRGNKLSSFSVRCVLD